MLDTDVCIYLIKNSRPAVLKTLLAKEPAQLFLSSIVVAELYSGVYKSRRVENNLTALLLFLKDFTILAFDQKASEACGRVRAELEAKGQPIGPYDTQVAAHALSANKVLVTHNTREFSRVPELAIEDWTQA